MKHRFFDILFSIVALFFLTIPLILIYLATRFTSTGAPLYWSKRIGVNNSIFLMPKFRTMKIDTPQLATHLINADLYLTKIGLFLRKTSLDELPQFYSVLVGDMSVVGPRPALFNQYDLIELRTQFNIHKLKPGITGWAQINGRDDLTNEQKVEFDLYYLKNKSLFFDIKIIIKTFLNVLLKKNIKH